MRLHGNARTCVHSRVLIVERVLEQGWRIAAAAEAAGVSERTAAKWLARYRTEGRDGLLDRSSAPKRVPRRTPAERVRVIEFLRRLRMTAAEIAEVMRMPLSTVSAVLRRIGLGRRSRLEPFEPANRYECARPGELVHIDVKKLARFTRPGHRMLGRGRGRFEEGAGYEYVHVCVDDFSRLAYVELLTDERAITAIGFLRRAVAWLAAQGIAVERVMTDNGPPTAHTRTAQPAHTSACATAGSNRAGHAPTAKRNASSKRSSPAGPTDGSTRVATNAPRHSHTGSTTTTTPDHTAASATNHQPAG